MSREDAVGGRRLGGILARVVGGGQGGQGSDQGRVAGSMLADVGWWGGRVGRVGGVGGGVPLGPAVVLGVARVKPDRVNANVSRRIGSRPLDHIRNRECYRASHSFGTGFRFPGLYFEFSYRPFGVAVPQYSH